LGDSINTIKKNIETLTDASKVIGLEVQIEKTNSIFMSRHQVARQNIKIANRTSEAVAKFK
jgi:ribosomal protein L20A (L18A)